MKNIKMAIKPCCHLLILMFLTILSGCGTPCLVIGPDPATGYFPTDKKLDSADIKLDKQVELKKFKKLLYIRKTATNGRCNHFVEKTLKHIGYFEHIKGKEEIAKDRVAKGLAETPYEVSDELILEQLKSSYKNFLIADYYIRSNADFTFIMDFKLITSDNNEVVLHLRRQAFNWSGLEKPLIWPILNGVKDWLVRNESI